MQDGASAGPHAAGLRVLLLPLGPWLLVLVRLTAGGSNTTSAFSLLPNCLVACVLPAFRLFAFLRFILLLCYARKLPVLSAGQSLPCSFCIHAVAWEE